MSDGLLPRVEERRLRASRAPTAVLDLPSVIAGSASVGPGPYRTDHRRSKTRQPGAASGIGDQAHQHHPLPSAEPRHSVRLTPRSPGSPKRRSDCGNTDFQTRTPCTMPETAILVAETPASPSKHPYHADPPGLATYLEVFRLPSAQPCSTRLPSVG